jgi:tRNA(Ile)-lysidine synthase
MQVLDRVRQFVRQHGLVRADTRVLAAVSGGSDSVALAHLLRDLDAAGDLQLVGLVHFNHQLRPSAGDDERFAAGVAASLGRPIVIDRGDVSARARRERRSIEDAARASRHEFFERARVACQADDVALGHTRDDQAETLLMRLTRGAGFRGLAGMYPRKDRIIRPLLGCRREELRAWLAARQISFVDDESNRDVRILRNRVRAELLPLLESRFNPAIVDVLADEAELARDTWAWMDAAADEATVRLVQTGDAVREIDAAGLRALPLALRRAVVWRAMSELGGGRPIGFGHVEAVLRLTSDAVASSEPGDHRRERIDLPGQRAERIGARVVLRGRPPHAVGRWSPDEQNRSNFFRYSLSIPGEVVLPEAGCRVSAEAVGGGGASLEPGAALGRGPVALVRSDVCHGSLAVRNRRPGDHFRPIGLDGRKKLQDFFVDRKIARRTRDAVPLVVDETDRIVWVAGHGIDEAFRVTDPAQAVLILKLKALGGSA